MAGPLLKRLQIEANATTGFDVVSPTDPITLYFKIALYIAIGLALPVLLWQVIGFLAPGLTKKEKRLLYLSLPFVVFLFLLGVAYGFFFAAPRALQFLSNFMSDLYEWSPEGSEVISFFLALMLGWAWRFNCRSSCSFWPSWGSPARSACLLSQVRRTGHPGPGGDDHAVDRPLQHDGGGRPALHPL